MGAFLQPVDALNALPVIEVTADSVKGVRRIYNQAPFLEYLADPVDQALLGVIRVDGKHQCFFIYRCRFVFRHLLESGSTHMEFGLLIVNTTSISVRDVISIVNKFNHKLRIEIPLDRLDGFQGSIKTFIIFLRIELEQKEWSYPYNEEETVVEEVTFELNLDIDTNTTFANYIHEIETKIQLECITGIPAYVISGCQAEINTENQNSIIQLYQNEIIKEFNPILPQVITENSIEAILQSLSSLNTLTGQTVIISNDPQPASFSGSGSVEWNTAFDVKLQANSILNEYLICYHILSCVNFFI